MGPLGIFRRHTLHKSPLSLAVPLDGTDHVMGLLELQRLSRRKESARSRYRRYKGPFIEQITLDDLQKKPVDWRHFFNNPQVSQPSYSVPGSVDCLLERLEENSVYYLPNYLQVMLMVTVLMLGAFYGSIVFLILGCYTYVKDVKLTALNHSTSKLVKEVALPVAILWCAFLAPIAVILARGIAMGLLIVLIHGIFHKSSSEIRWSKMGPITRWLKRKHAPLEGMRLLAQDLGCRAADLGHEFAIWSKWRWFELREFYIKKKWQIWSTMRSPWRKSTKRGLW